MDTPDPTQALALSAAQEFEVERFSRIIDTTSDVLALREMAKRFLHLWQTQKAATTWALRQQVHRAPFVTPETMAPHLANARAAAEQMASLEACFDSSPGEDDTTAAA